MKFLIDESTDARLATYLVSLGHDAVFVARAYGPGLSDKEILAIARSEGRILITDDRDFGELVFRGHHPHQGVIFFRLPTTLLTVRIDRLNYVLSHYTDHLDQFLVVSRNTVRIRTTRRDEPS